MIRGNTNRAYPGDRNWSGKFQRRRWILICTILTACCGGWAISSTAQVQSVKAPVSDLKTPVSNLWALAQRPQQVHRFSTLFTAQDVRNHLSTPEGLEKAVDWCRRTAVTKVYIETFRDRYQA
ncbi:MAG: hypothetical protein HY674_22535, partial [Chloroflexi bacterium]|nr:hypothetical protein [Chloroflexota bacterium]